MLLWVLLLCYGCGSGGDPKVVDFSKITQIERDEERHYGEHSLRVAVASMISPKETFTNYRQILEYIGARLDKDTELIQRKTYGEVNELLGQGECDLAFICSGPYATGKEKYDLELLAVPQVRGSPFYHSYLIVNKDSPFLRLEDLRGRIFAFTDPDSNTGKLVPTYWLMQVKERPETFFGEIVYTYSHDNSILAVSRGLVDGAAVHGLIWEYYHRKHPALTASTRIIKKSEPFGAPPVVASKHLPGDLKERISQLLFSMHQDPEGQIILEGLLIDKLIPPREEWYESIRGMRRNLSLLEMRTDVVPKSQK
jgi:phosphonate transport system substrate-binding protein